MKYAEQYNENRIYHARYKKSKDKDRYLRQHETELILYNGAEAILHRLGIDTRELDANQIRQDYNALISYKNSLNTSYRSAKQNAKDLHRKVDTINAYLHQSPMEPTNTSERQKNDRIHGL